MKHFARTSACVQCTRERTQQKRVRRFILYTVITLCTLGLAEQPRLGWVTTPDFNLSEGAVRETPVKNPSRSPNDEIVHFDLSARGFGHDQFHERIRTAIIRYYKSRLRDFGKADGLVVVAGVEYGMEIDEYLKEGWQTLAFEPNPTYHDTLLQKCTGICELNKCGVGENNVESVQLNYHGHMFHACVVQLDTILDHKIVSLSIDIQGLELDVLKGARQLIANNRIDIIFAEYQPGSSCETLLSFLFLNGYILFDFLWYGESVLSGQTENVLFDWDNSTSANIVDYCRLTSLVNKGYAAHYYPGLHSTFGNSHLWLQNDIVAIHHSSFDSNFSNFLKTFE